MENNRQAVTFVIHGQPLEFAGSVKSITSIIKELIYQDIKQQLDNSLLTELEQRIIKEGKTGGKFKQINVRFNMTKENDLFDFVATKENRALYLKTLLYYAMEKNITECVKTSRVFPINVCLDEHTYNSVKQQAEQEKQSISLYLYNVIKKSLNNQ